MKVHVKKCHPESFQAIRDGRKRFEWRAEDDCIYAVGDMLILLEWRPGDAWTWNEDEQRNQLAVNTYTGEVEKRLVTYVLRGEFGVPHGYVVLSLAPLP